ncbi:hypothetical protein FRC12_000418 [Ceratobasidium sp. 428]|nr:hypothetical protein FRC09_015501 [Ceratobasidium sp. 395]KAG8777368.1 hypothetical protein FRC12_000418 [Ceratobasidium sp. 428]
MESGGAPVLPSSLEHSGEKTSFAEKTGIQVEIEKYIQIVAELDGDMAKVKVDYMTIGQLPLKANRKAPAPPNPVVTPPVPSPPSKGNLKEVV